MACDARCWSPLESVLTLLRRRIPAGEGDPDLMAVPRWQTTLFAVSEVTGTRRSTRLVIVRSVLSFLFNAAVVAIALDWIKSGG